MHTKIMSQLQSRIKQRAAAIALGEAEYAWLKDDRINYSLNTPSRERLEKSITQNKWQLKLLRDDQVLDKRIMAELVIGQHYISYVERPRYDEWDVVYDEELDYDQPVDSDTVFSSNGRDYAN